MRRRASTSPPDYQPPAPREVSPYPPLLIEYLVLYFYGVSAAWIGVVTIDVAAGGPGRSVLWGVAIAVFAVFAMAGVFRSLVSSKYKLEIWSTLPLLALFMAYAVAIIARVVVEQDLARLPAVFLPIALSVFPFARLVNIAPRRRIVNFPRRSPRD